MKHPQLPLKTRPTLTSLSTITQHKLNKKQIKKLKPENEWLRCHLLHGNIANCTINYMGEHLMTNWLRTYK